MSDSNPSQATPAELYQLNARYLVDPDATASDLLSDATIWLEGSIASVEATAMELSRASSMLITNPAVAARILFNASYMLRMCDGAVQAANRQILEAQS